MVESLTPAFWVELLAASLSLIGVWFAAHKKIISWPLSMAGTLMYAGIFFENRLWANMGLQFVFIGFQVYGWIHWQKLMLAQDNATKPLTALMRRWLPFFGLFLFGLLLISNILFEASLPIPDALTTAISVCAQFLLARKHRENWLLWIIADCIYVLMFIHQGLTITAGLYAILLIMCFIGWRKWRQ